VSFHQLFHIHHHLHLSSGADKINQTVTDVRSGLSLTPLIIIIIKSFDGTSISSLGDGENLTDYAGSSVRSLMWNTP
jgi:hypothetical protein